jgi:hypothetical protein
MPGSLSSIRGGCLTLLLVLAAGCASGPPLPKTYPASGKVVYKGGQPMTGGSIQFNSTNSTSDQLLQVIGEIQVDGTFRLRTLKDNARADGAPQGDFQVVVLPPMVSEPPGGGAPRGHRAPQPIPLPKVLKVEARENSFAIELPAAPPK